jgi:hypothetical protein
MRKNCELNTGHLQDEGKPVDDVEDDGEDGEGDEVEF